MAKRILLKQTHKDRCNCIKYARSFVPSLPYALWTLGDKRRICNSKKPEVGAIAMMAVGLPWGHAGYVNAVSGKLITIKEANYIPCRLTMVKGTASELKIVGYYLSPKLRQKQATVNEKIALYVKRYKKNWKKSPVKSLINRMRVIYKKRV